MSPGAMPPSRTSGRQGEFGKYAPAVELAAGLLSGGPAPVKNVLSGVKGLTPKLFPEAVAPMSTAQRYALASQQGAGISALAGFNYGEGLEGSLTGAAEGAAVGAVAGPLLLGAVKGGGAIARNPTVRAMMADTSGSILGDRAAQFSLIEKEIAKKMMAEGASDDEIWRATQMAWNAQQRAWMSEGTDEGYDIDIDRLQQMAPGQFELAQNVLTHPNYEANYGAELVDPLGRPLRLGPLITDNPQARGRYSPKEHAIQINPFLPAEQVLKTGSHELVHAVPQRRQGWQGGAAVKASPRVYKGPYFDPMLQAGVEYEVATQGKNYTGAKLTEHRAKQKQITEGLLQAAQYEGYRRSPGENIANIAPARLGMSEPGRAVRSLTRDLEYPYEQQWGAHGNVGLPPADWYYNNPPEGAAVAADEGPERIRLSGRTEAGPLTPEVAAENFNNWFGQSKVVDEKGKPLTVYHGTPGPAFEQFDKSFINPNDPDGPYNGFWFSSDKDEAASAGQFPWARPNSATATTGAYNLSMQNPAPRAAIADAKQAWRDQLGKGEGLTLQDFTRQHLQQQGYDGIFHTPYRGKLDREAFERDGQVKVGPTR